MCDSKSVELWEYLKGDYNFIFIDKYNTSRKQTKFSILYKFLEKMDEKFRLIVIVQFSLLILITPNM